jgi:predicted outer membrane protein
MVFLRFNKKIKGMKTFLKGLLQLFLIPAIIVTLSCNSGTATSSSDSVSVTKSMMTDTTKRKRDTTSLIDSPAVVKPGPSNDASVVISDNDFISKNINDNMMEVKLSELGRDKGTDARVKKAATQMLADHTQMLNDLKMLAANKKVEVPAANTNIMSNPALSEATAKEFDQTWATQMLGMHEAKINELQNVLTQTRDADIKALTAKALPKIKMHREMLAKIVAAIGAAGILNK